MAKRPPLWSHSAHSSGSVSFAGPAHSKKFKPNTARQDEDEMWGNDDDDEILLMASQACERIDASDIHVGISEIPVANASGSRLNPNELKFQKMDANINAQMEKWWKDEDFDHLSLEKKPSSDETAPNGYEHLSVEKKTDATEMASNDYVQSLLKQNRALKMENQKLKMECESLTVNCLDKQGESTNLRLQLKSASNRLESYKLEAVKEKKKEHFEWSKSLENANKEVQNFRSQLEFKKLEVENLKDKCKLLESGKIKSVEVCTPNRDVKWPNFSQSLNNSFSKSDAKSKPSITENSLSNSNITIKISDNDRLIFKDIPISIFRKYSKTRCLPFSILKPEKMTFKCLSSNSMNEICTNREEDKKENTFQDVEENIALIMKMKRWEISLDLYLDSFLRIMIAVRELLFGVLQELRVLEKENLSKLLTISNDKYLEISSEMFVHDEELLFSERLCCENEAGVEARRLCAVLSKICKRSSHISSSMLGINCSKFLLHLKNPPSEFKLVNQFNAEYPITDGFLKLLTHICQKINGLGCSFIYTGLLAVIVMTLKNTLKCLQKVTDSQIEQIFLVLKEVLYSRPHITVLIQIANAFKFLSQYSVFLNLLCNSESDRNVKIDHIQQVSVFNNETCFIQVFSTQLEAYLYQCDDLKCITNAFTIADTLLWLIYYGSKSAVPWSNFEVEANCKSNYKIHQCLVLSLHKCSCFYKKFLWHIKDTEDIKFYNLVLKSGIIILSYCTLDDADFHARLGDCEGHLQSFLSNVTGISDHLQFFSIHKEALADLTSKILVTTNENSMDENNSTMWEEHFSLIKKSD